MVGARRITTHASPPDARPPRVPAGAGLLREAAFARQAVRIAARWPSLRRGRTGRATVVLVPGYLTTATTMAPLGWYLRRLGHRVVPWGFGLNRGTPEDDLPRMVTRIQALTQAYPEPVVLVGWSLGGVIARETAREAPELVAGVVTYGTPIVGGPTFTVAGDRWPEEECARISALVEERDANDPLRTPVTVIFSRNDGVVDWPAALDRTSLDVRHVEVASSHVGLGFDPDVWEIVADAAATYSETAA